MKTALWIATAATAAIATLAACSEDNGTDDSVGTTPAGTESAGTAPAGTAPATVEEPLPTAEESAAQAAERIDEDNADAELQRLQDELGDG